ncbi:MAG: MFS transporter [Rhizobiaceae bacterium]
MRQIHSPVWLAQATTAGSYSFAVLFVLETFSRAVLIAVVPLLALELLGDAQGVSMFYFSISIAGLLSTLAVPWLVQRLRRRSVLSISVFLLCASAPVLANQTMVGLIIGMVLHVAGAATLSICLNLYVLDNIRPKALTRFEPLRMLFVGAAWVVAPVLGIYLGKYGAPWLPYAASAGFALILLGYFWFLRITENPILAPLRSSATNPLYFVRRYFSQPRLVLAWFLAVGRTGWWTMFFVYAPIYAVTSGMDAEAGGWIVSAGSASLFVVTFWGWIGRRFGLRRLLIWGYVAVGLFTIAMGIVADTPWLGITMLLLACLAASAIDGAGNVPFLRAVRSRERSEMTTVFSSNRDVARLIIPGIFVLVLNLFALPAVFVTSGLIMLVMAAYARHIPRRL